MNYLIAREGWPFIAAALAVLIIFLTIGSLVLGLIGLFLLIFIIWFFRNPEREIPRGDDIVVSPADGKVIAIKDTGEGTKISIFMSILNVHINRVPCSGLVKKVEYNKGKFLVASKDKASLDNEQNAVTVVDAMGRTVRFVQIAGFIARRIVCYLKEGDRVVQGERFGLIRFGSRMDVYLQSGFKPRVTVGDKVQGGSTILGTYG